MPLSRRLHARADRHETGVERVENIGEVFVLKTLHCSEYGKQIILNQVLFLFLFNANLSKVKICNSMFGLNVRTKSINLD